MLSNLRLTPKRQGFELVPFEANLQIGSVSFLRLWMSFVGLLLGLIEFKIYLPQISLTSQISIVL